MAVLTYCFFPSSHPDYHLLLLLRARTHAPQGQHLLLTPLTRRGLTIAGSGGTTLGEEARPGSRRGRRRRKSDEELCDELRAFVKLVDGTDGDRMPSIKELADRGRKDLANIVRRRGYRAISELLMNLNGRTSSSQELSNRNEEHNHAVKDENPGNEGALIISTEGISQPNGFSTVDIAMNKYVANSNGAVLRNDRTQLTNEFSTQTLHSKATKFIQTGELDLAEDLVNFTSELGSSAKDNSKLDEAPLVVYEQPGLTLDKGLLEREHTSSGLQSNPDESSSSMVSQNSNEDEMHHLKALLHQKEMELSQLKKQIEQEKLQLFNLQDKAKAVIESVQQTIEEKDVELHATEENLNELKEVHIDYWTTGEVVEVAGSFNGWQHRIKMDMDPSSRSHKVPNSRHQLLWSTVLWLYPGVYEIKFIVDGIWKSDSQRETTTNGTISNNVLRVDG